MLFKTLISLLSNSTIQREPKDEIRLWERNKTKLIQTLGHLSSPPEQLLLSNPRKKSVQKTSLFQWIGGLKAKKQSTNYQKNTATLINYSAEH